MLALLRTLLRTLSPSDCHPAGPAGPYVAGGPVGPDGSLKVLEPLENSRIQTVSYVMRDEWDTFDDDSLAEATDADSPTMDEFYQRVVSSDDEDFVDSDDGSVADLDRDMSEEEDFVDSDDGSVADLDRDMSDEEDCCDLDVGSVADLEWDTWADACTLAFQGAVGAFPPEAAEIRPAVVFWNSLFPGEECSNAVVSV